MKSPPITAAVAAVEAENLKEHHIVNRNISDFTFLIMVLSFETMVRWVIIKKALRRLKIEPGVCCKNM